MNIFEMNQRAFPGVAAGGSLPPTSVDVKPSPVSARRRGSVFQVSKKPSNVAVFLVSFLSYLVGVFPSMVFALPTGGTVQAGSATINQPTSEQMIIQQTTDKAVIDWQEFGIGSAEHVDFQLSQGGVTLNRVTGNDVSQIFGKLTSNGDLWLINPNGILFGATAQVDVRGLLATTSDISNADFLSSNYNFGVPSSLSSTVVNQGSITAAEGGLVALVAPGVQNMGIITARLGKVSLASGKTFTVDLYGDQLINLGVDSQVMGQVTGMDGEVLSSLVTNSGSVFADGGVVRLDVNAAQGIVDRVINMDGVIQAHSVSEQNGTIILSGGEAGEVHVAGTLDASGYGEGETGGTVHVLGDMLAFYDNGLIDVSGDLGGGTLLFGGDYQGQGSVPNATDVFVGPNTQTFAVAVTSGNGGKLIFWADRRMRFYGIVKGRGGKYFGDGGFVEVSGKEELYFDGFVDTTAANGKTGTLLLDPEELTIAKGSGPSTSSAATFDLGGNKTGPSLGTIFESTLEGASQTTNVVLLATNSIVLGKNSSEQISLNMQQGSGNSVTFKVTDGTISFANTLSSVSTQGGDIIFDASGDLSLGSLTSNGGDISLTGSDLTLLNTDTRLSAGTGNINITEDLAGDIGLGDSTTCTGTCGMTISNSDLSKMSGNKLIINGSSNNGAIYVGGVTQTTSTFTGGVELKDAHISGAKGGVFFEGAASTFSTLTAESLNGMEVNANLTTTAGALTLDGDSNNVAESVVPNDSMTIASGVTLTSASNISLSATTGGISAAGALTLNAPSSITLTGNLTATGAVDLSANSGITLNNNITSSSSLNINANSSTLSLASGVVLSSAGALTLAASDASSLGSLTLTSTGSTININNSLTSTGAVDITANSGLFLNNSTLTGAGNITLQGGSGLTLVSSMGITSSAGNITLGASGGSITANGAFTLSSNGSITVSDALTSAGAATLNANSGITLGNNFTANGTVSLDADLDNNGAGDFTISSGTLSTTNNALTVTANDLILTGILDSGTGSTTISVSDGDSLSVGFTGTGMSLDDATELAKIQGTGDINLLNGNIVVASGTTLSSSGKLTLGQSGGTITGQGALTLTGANGLVINSSTVSATGALSLNATTGGISTLGAITLNATDGITISDTFTSAGATTIDADTDDTGTGTFTLSSGLSTGNNALSITAVDLVLNGTLDSGNAGTTILASQSTNTIGLGVATGNKMTLDNTDLGNIIANSLTIGDGTNGNIIVDGVTTTSSDQFGSLTLNATDSASSVTFGAGDSTFQGLTVNAGDGIALSSNLTTNGTTTFNSDSNGTGTGSFTINSLKTLNTNNNALTITSKSMSLNSDGAINSGNAGTTLQVSQSGDTIGLGGGAGTFSLSSNDLAQITASGLTIGNATNGTITVDGVTSTSTPLTLIANSGTSAVNFSSNASSFNNLTLDAGTGGVSFGSNLSAADFSVTSGGTITDTGILTIGGTSSFTTDVANQAITLDNTSNSFTGAVSLNTTGTGDATLTSNNAVTLSTSTVGNNLDVTVRGDNSLNVTGKATAGGPITLSADDDIIFTAAGDLSANGNITVKADNDLDKNGSGGALTMVDGTVFNAGSGTIELSADEDITLGRVETSSSSDAAVTLTSTSSGAVDGDTAVPPEFTALGGDSTPWLDIDAANGRLVAEVATGFGAENAIETKVQSLDIDNSTSGKVDIFEFDELDIFKINNAGGSVEVSFEGDLTGQANCVGTCLFVRRDIRNALIGSKSLGQLANASNEQLSFAVFELLGPNFLEKTPVGQISGSPNGPFTADLFSEKFELVELAAGTDGKFDGMEVSQSFWGGAKPPTLEVAEWKSSDKKNRSRQRSAKRKKRIGKKVDDTASITLNKPVRKTPKPRIQKSESGYLGFAP
jgi:filamentous hemagglutinin family protein